jgi:hypothetical protein
MSWFNLLDKLISFCVSLLFLDLFCILAFGVLIKRTPFLFAHFKGFFGEVFSDKREIMINLVESDIAGSNKLFYS